MLDLYRLSEDFDDFGTYQAAERERRGKHLRRACDALEECAPAWEALREKVQRADPTRLVARLREAPDRTYAAAERPTPVTAVATDGSQVYPDRHVEPTCYLLNVSRVAFQYGTLEPPVLDADPHFQYRDCALSEHFDALSGSVSAELVSALRDEKELEALLDASRAARRAGRPLVALADGTLIRWMIRGMRNRDLEEELIGRYAALLDAFREERLPLCSYVSMPGNTEMVNLLSVHLGREDALDGLLDRWLFADTLGVGERSATFESPSHIQRDYGPESQICYFYARVPAGTQSEIARVEVPRWVADDAALLGRVHSLVTSECEKGDGYPMILAEAHERAVIRAPEKERFYDLIGRAMEGQGLGPMRRSRKAQSKRRPAF